MAPSLPRFIGLASRRKTTTKFLMFWSELETADEIHNPYAQRVGDDFERLNRDVTLASLNFSDVGTVQSRLLGKGGLYVYDTVIAVQRCHSQWQQGWLADKGPTQRSTLSRPRLQEVGTRRSRSGRRC